MHNTLFDLGYVDNKPISFSLLIKVYNTKFWSYEVVKKMHLTLQKFAKSGYSYFNRTLLFTKGYK